MLRETGCGGQEDVGEVKKMMINVSKPLGNAEKYNALAIQCMTIKLQGEKHDDIKGVHTTVQH